MNLMEIPKVFKVSNDEMQVPVAIYHGWNVYYMSWYANMTKIAAAKYAFADLRSPVVHCNYTEGNLTEYEAALAKVHAEIDSIEALGFDTVVDALKNRAINGSW